MTAAELRRKAFALAGEIAGPGEPAYQLLHDISGQASVGGRDAEFWSGMVDHLQDLKRRQMREAPGCTAKQWRYIERLREKLGMSEEHWRNFLRKQLRIEHQRFLNVTKARGAIAGLKKMLERRAT